MGWGRHSLCDQVQLRGAKTIKYYGCGSTLSFRPVDHHPTSLWSSRPRCHEYAYEVICSFSLILSSYCSAIILRLNLLINHMTLHYNKIGIYLLIIGLYFYFSSSNYSYRSSYYLLVSCSINHGMYNSIPQDVQLKPQTGDANCFQTPR